MAGQLQLVCACLILSLATVKANYSFTARFYAFRNPLRLQCSRCLNGGQPACCDNPWPVLSNISCTLITVPCETGFRFMLRPYGAPVDTAPTRNVDFPQDYITTAVIRDDSIVFDTGRRAFRGLPNPFTLTSTNQWNGRIQFFIDAIDIADRPRETVDIINRFPINLVLELGATFTTRTTYNGTFNILNEFDMSFRVQCSDNYYGSNCSIFCIPRPLEGVNCDSQVGAVCTQNNRDPSANCSSCLQGFLGENCDISDPCEDSSNPCENGICTANDTTGDYKCHCEIGYEGINCTEEINKCLPNPCLNNGSCTELFADYQCTCPADFSGKNCDTCECNKELNFIRLASVGGASILSVAINVILFTVVIVQCCYICISKKTTRIPNGIGSYQNGDDRIVMKPNIGYHGVNPRFEEQSIHYYTNDEFGPRMRPADSANEYHYALL